MGRILAVCSGCGGTGKSTVALSAAVAAAKRGLQTILLDVSGISRSCDLMLGLESVVVLDIMDVIRQQTSIQSALYKIPGRENLRFACASLYEGVSLSNLSAILLALRAMSDLLVLDLPSGPVAIPDGLMDESDVFLMLTRPDDISIRSLERLMSRLPFGPQRHLIVNRLDPLLVRKKAQYTPDNTQMILDLPVSACMHEDVQIAAGMQKGKAASECSGRFKSELNRMLEQIL